MKNEPEILDQREASTMVSSWTEYLCVRRIRKGLGRIEICGYEALGEFEGTDEDGNEIDPPQRVGEKCVIGVEDGYLVGDDLTCVSDDKHFSFGIVTISEALDWIKRENFEVTSQTRKTLMKAIT